MPQTWQDSKLARQWQELVNSDAIERKRKRDPDDYQEDEDDALEEEVALIVAADEKEGAGLGSQANGIAPRMAVKNQAVLVNCAEPQAGETLVPCFDPG